ncbi:MAG: hypothetical protein EXR53_04090 [Dehalococcoidia bacterium]|nr:hypothetical protein [Dehalococcoidia bacterium]
MENYRSFGESTELIQNSRDVAYEKLMSACYSQMASYKKPKQVAIDAWLKHMGLPAIFGWKSDLWYRMLIWEFNQWISRIHEKSGLSHAKTMNALFQRMPLPEADPLYFKTANAFEKELNILWRWLYARGWYLNDIEREEVARRFTGIP